MSFNFSYEKRDNKTMIDQLGLFLSRIADCTPGGILVFFPCYKYMKSVDLRWQESGVFDEINSRKNA